LEQSKYPIFFQGTGNVHIILRNVIFQNNSHMPVFEVGTMATANFCEVQDLHLINCSFVGNTATALYVESSHIHVHGKLIFTGNTAYEGAAMYFGIETYISVDSDAEISFKHNYADHTGGGIKVAKRYVSLFL